MQGPWQPLSRRIDRATIVVSLELSGRRLTVGDVLEALRAQREFRTFFTGLLCAVPFEAFCWETPPLTRTALRRPFECAFVDSPALAKAQADPQPFEAQLRFARGAEVMAFDNLGGDARLVVPCPAPGRQYPHLATFCRSAPPPQADALWAKVGEQAQARIGEAPFWLSTAGLGVYWLHVRLDQRPKYYRYAPYKTPGFWN